MITELYIVEETDVQEILDQFTEEEQKIINRFNNLLEDQLRSQGVDTR